MKGLIIVLISLLANSPTFAADWVPLTVGEDKATVSVDTTSFKFFSDGIRAVWLKTEYVPYSMRDPVDPSEWWAELIHQEAFDCKQNSRMGLASTVYFQDGTHATFKGHYEWEPVVPDTVSDTVMKFVCSWKPKKRS